MKDFDELKTIWHGQTDLPKIGYDDILKKIRKTKLAFSNKLLFQMIILGSAIAVLIYLLFSVPFQLSTSPIAIGIFILCCLAYLIIQIRDYRKISNSESLLNMPDEYIAYLKSYKRTRYLLNTRIYRIYMLFMGLGFALYFIEVFYSVSIWQTILAVTFTVFWFFISYYVFMRMYIRKEETRLNEMIRNLERLQNQFK